MKISQVAKYILPKINLLVLFVNLFLGGYLVIYPIYPLLHWQLKQIEVPGVDLTFLQSDAKISQNSMPNYNFIAIDKIGVEGKLHSGTSSSLLDEGIWHKENSGNPVTGGNMVVIAHRFLYTFGSETFYHLDKLSVGDEIQVAWDNQLFDYRVVDTKVVSADSLWIEEETESHQITLYTCTPLWSSTERLVVIAKPINT